jgi:hypothetical protein
MPYPILKSVRRALEASTPRMTRVSLTGMLIQKFDDGVLAEIDLEAVHLDFNLVRCKTPLDLCAMEFCREARLCPCTHPAALFGFAVPGSIYRHSHRNPSEHRSRSSRSPFESSSLVLAGPSGANNWAKRIPRPPDLHGIRPTDQLFDRETASARYVDEPWNDLKITDRARIRV